MLIKVLLLLVYETPPIYIYIWGSHKVARAILLFVYIYIYIYVCILLQVLLQHDNNIFYSFSNSVLKSLLGHTSHTVNVHCGVTDIATFSQGQVRQCSEFDIQRSSNDLVLRRCT